jgi:threonine dehydratase
MSRGEGANEAAEPPVEGPREHTPPTLEEIQAARRRIEGVALRTPLVRLNVDDAPAEIYLKLENLQPIGSFKIRGAQSAMGLLDPAELRAGVWTASAGNMAQGVAWCARQIGVPCSVVIPDTAPEAKRSAIQRLGARMIPVPVEEWFDTFRTHRHEGLQGLFVHPFSDRAVMAGNGTIGLEILEDVPDADAVLVPYGGGGLVCGIASALRAAGSGARVFGCEAETAAPLAAALEAGSPTRVEYRPSFVDGIGAPEVFPEMFPMAQALLAGSLVVSLVEVADALRVIAQRNHVIAEGAGAVPVAAALTGNAGSGKVVCVVSGGNIDDAKLAEILQGQVP